MPSAARPGAAALARSIEALPVSGRRDEIVAALRAHPVVIVCGETGSGKTTQLPKLCLAAGRGRRDPATGRGGLIGHTQPRRLAATSVATRIAEELGTPLGTDVGYRIRFGEKVSATLRIKLMTDGILLAETQSDRLLRRYDTIIIDEAHERSLNIDFLLGYLKRLLDGPRRDDLKVVVTSATIDAERFARHFARDGQPAPVIEVSGRLYPVEVRYRPLEDGSASAGRRGADAGARGEPRAAVRADADDEDDLPSAVESAIQELWRERPGDVLVFLPGEREIRDCAAHLARHADRLRDPEVLSLYSRLSASDQQKVFSPGDGLRIVLATNVAETSLTVPRIRYVVDSGLARVKRYRIRGKVEQLLVEPVSQAAANQRAGRCGRVSDGVCVRLYEEADFQKRPRYSDPEILRSSLASVILRMHSLGLADVDAFPFLDAPSSRSIADGYALLLELGAVDDQRELTPSGRELARFPVDPRTARMLQAGRDLDCLDEVCVIAAALSTQDPRDRPMTAAAAADQSHRRFADPQSDFIAILKLWRYWESQQAGRSERGESHRALAGRLAREFLSVRRLREWADVHQQLQQMLREAGWSGGGRPGPAVAGERNDAIHRALLTGLLGNIGMRAVDGPHYLGAHQQKFALHPSSALARKASAAGAARDPAGADADAAGPGGDAAGGRRGRWVMAAEMVDTGRLYARTVARIGANWIEQAGAHLVARSWSDPHWEKRSGRVMAAERGTLYGLTLYSGRRVPFAPIDAAQARELMIREALVPGEWPSERPFVRHNRQVIADIQKLEHKIRRPDLLIDDQALFEWFDQRVPADVADAAALERWLAGDGRADALSLSRDALLRKDADAIDAARFPRHLRMNGVAFALDYRFEPGASDDGVTMTVPLYALNQVDHRIVDWLVPGMLAAKVEILLRSLPQRHRRRLLPLDATVAAFIARATPGAPLALVDALIADLQATLALVVRSGDFRPENVPEHLQMNFRVVDEHGRFLAMSRHLPQLRSDLGARAQSSFQAAFAGVAARIAPVATTPATAATDASGASAGSGASAAAAVPAGPADAPSPSGMPAAGARSTTWSFGELAEIVEVKAPDGRLLIGYPALVDRGDGVELQVFDEPQEAAERHRSGVRRLFLLAMGEAVRFFEREVRKDSALELGFATLPGQQGGAGRAGGSAVAAQVCAATAERCFLGGPLPTDEAGFKALVAAGRPRFSLTAQELLRLVRQIVDEHGQLRRRLGGLKGFPAVTADIDAQLRALFEASFVERLAFAHLSNYPRYLKAIAMRLDKLREGAQQDQARMLEVQGLAARWQRRVRVLKGNVDPDLEAFRWMLEELRVSLFAQTLRTPYPVSVKRLDKILDRHESR